MRGRTRRWQLFLVAYCNNAFGATLCVIVERSVTPNCIGITVSRWAKTLLLIAALAGSFGGSHQSHAGRYGGIRGSRFPSYRKASSSPSYRRPPSSTRVAQPVVPPAQPASPPPARRETTPQPVAEGAQGGPVGRAATADAPAAVERSALETALDVLDRVGSWVAKVDDQTSVQLELRPDGA